MNEGNVSASVGCVSIKLDLDLHVLLRMNYDNFDYLSFNLAPPPVYKV